MSPPEMEIAVLVCYILQCALSAGASLNPLFPPEINMGKNKGVCVCSGYVLFTAVTLFSIVIYVLLPLPPLFFLASEDSEAK